MKILLTNDDGINADGLKALAEKLKNDYELTIVAPQSEQSGVGHAITLKDPIRIKNVTTFDNAKAISVDGTPADCVKFALKQVLQQEKPDCLISGINRGPNIGVNVLYSGTVAATAEGTIYNIPSIAVSVTDYENPNYETAADFIHEILPDFLKNPPPPSSLLNVNIPKGIPKGVKVTQHGRSGFDEDFELRYDKRKNPYYWIFGEMTDRDNPEIQTDYRALEQGFITLTPISIILTSDDYYKQLKENYK